MWESICRIMECTLNSAAWHHCSILKNWICPFQTWHIPSPLVALMTPPQYFMHCTFSICICVCPSHWILSSFDSRDIRPSSLYFPFFSSLLHYYLSRILFCIKVQSEFLLKFFLNAKKLKAMNLKICLSVLQEGVLKISNSNYFELKCPHISHL